MEMLLGHQSSFIHCTQITTLLEEISNANGYKVYIISCLSGILGYIAESHNAKTGIERAMGMLGNSIGAMITRHQGALRVVVCQATPRSSPDFAKHHQFALV